MINKILSIIILFTLSVHTLDAYNIVSHPVELDTSILEQDYQYRYDPNTPTQSFDLPESLLEISGLSINKSGDALIAINDESGILHFIDVSTGKLLSSKQFWKKGDYEAVELVGEAMYVIKSSGTLYEVMLDNQDSLTTTKYKSHLTKELDIEGLGYDEKTNSLLIGCKGQLAQPAGSEEKKKRSIFRCNITDSISVDREPLFIITQEEMLSFVQANPSLYKQKKLIAHLSNQEEFKFKPSGIAVHPTTNNIHILSSAGKMLLVLNPNGNILHVQKLNKSVHPQPEGIAFDPRGNLFISNEGSDKVPAQIHFFTLNSQ